ncbi:MAG: hypothetical protein ACRCXQ_11870 [Vagococcus fluvialis]
MSKKLWLLIALLSVVLLVGCGKKESVNHTNKNEPIEMNTEAINEDGYENENGDFVPFSKVKENMNAYDQAIKEEDFDKALELEDWLRANSHRNGMTEEEINHVTTNHGGLVELDKVKEALTKAKENEDMSTERSALNGLKGFEESLTTDSELKIINEKYQKEVEKVYSDLAKKTGIPRVRDIKKNDRIGSGNEDYDEDGKYIDGGDDVSNDPISVDKVESSDYVYGD